MPVKHIGIITNDRHQVFQRDIIAGVEAITAPLGVRVSVDSIAEDPNKIRPVSLPISTLNGLIIIADVLDEATIRQIYTELPHITFVSHHIKGLPIPAITQNNSTTMQKMVAYLVRQCHRREFVFIRGYMSQHDALARDTMFRQNLLRYDLTVQPHRLLRGDFDPTIAVQSMRDLLKHDRAFDAVVASDYLMACAVLDVLRENGLRVPEDVCVIGFGDGIEAERAELTTIAADVVQIGKRAARQLLAQMDGKHITGITWLDADLTIRSTCCESTQA